MSWAAAPRTAVRASPAALAPISVRRSMRTAVTGVVNVLVTVNSFSDCSELRMSLSVEKCSAGVLHSWIGILASARYTAGSRFSSLYRRISQSGPLPGELPGVKVTAPRASCAPPLRLVRLTINDARLVLPGGVDPETSRNDEAAE